MLALLCAAVLLGLGVVRGLVELFYREGAAAVGLSLVLLLPLASIAVLVGIVWWRGRRQPGARCGVCGYDRTGLPPGTACSECGATPV